MSVGAFKCAWNHYKNKFMKKVSITFFLLSVIFCVFLVCSNFFVSRLWSLGFMNLQMSGALLIFPITYVINDVLTEVYGYRATRLVIWMGFALSLFISIFSLLVTKLPAPIYPESRIVACNFDSIYSFVPRAIAASLMAFVFGSLVNAFVMSKMKLASSGKHFWMRAILSSFAGEVIDSLIFFPIAYAGTLRLSGMLGLMATETVAKTLYEILILPVTILVVRKVKVHEGIDTFDQGISYNPFSFSDT